MPECTFHPGVETGLRCVECERPICPQEWVSTPVGYKCPDCAEPLPSARRVVKPKQLVLAVLAALVVGIGGAFLVELIGWFTWALMGVVGIATGEAARRASGGHRGVTIAAVAGISALIGSLLAGLGFFPMAVGTLAAAAYVAANNLRRV